MPYCIIQHKYGSNMA